MVSSGKDGWHPPGDRLGRAPGPQMAFAALPPGGGRQQLGIQIQGLQRRSAEIEQPQLPSSLSRLRSSVQRSRAAIAALHGLQLFFDFVRTVRNFRCTTTKVPRDTAGKRGRARGGAGKRQGGGKVFRSAPNGSGVETPDVVWCQLRPRMRVGVSQ